MNTILNVPVIPNFPITENTDAKMANISLSSGSSVFANSLKAAVSQHPTTPIKTVIITLFVFNLVHGRPPQDVVLVLGHPIFSKIDGVVPIFFVVFVVRRTSEDEDRPAPWRPDTWLEIRKNL